MPLSQSQSKIIVYVGIDLEEKLKNHFFYELAYCMMQKLQSSFVK
jgi:hypothetical protein